MKLNCALHHESLDFRQNTVERLVQLMHTTLLQRARILTRFHRLQTCATTSITDHFEHCLCNLCPATRQICHLDCQHCDCVRSRNAADAEGLGVR